MATEKPVEMSELPRADAEALSKQESATLEGSVADEKQRKHIHAWKKGDDEALKVLAEHVGEDAITKEEEKKLLRRIDWRILPVLGVTYGLQSMDKGALGVAAVFGITGDLGLIRVVSTNPLVTDSSRYSYVSMIFFVGFVVGAWPLAAIAQRFPIGRVCAIYCLLWGIICLLTIACFNYPAIMAQRFFLGFIESGVSPAFLLLISSWYEKSEQGFRTSFMYSMPGFWTMPFYAMWVGIAKGVGPNAQGQVNAWREIYGFMGGLTIVWSIVIWLVLPDSPVNARWLSEREKYVAVERMRVNQAGLKSKTFKWDQALAAFTDIKNWFLWGMAFAAIVPVGILTNFASLVVRDVVGAGTYRAVIISSAGGAVIVTLCLTGGLLAWKVRNVRGAIYIFGVSIALLASGLLWKLPLSNKSGLVAGVQLLNFSSVSYAMCLGFTASNTAGYSKRVVVSAMTFVAYCCGNIAGPLLFKRYEAPRYPTGFRDSVICLAVGAVCCAIYLGLCWRENHIRSKLPPKEVDEAFDDLTDSQNKAFRYAL